jgi:hypothetical protein
MPNAYSAAKSPNIKPKNCHSQLRLRECDFASILVDQISTDCRHPVLEVGDADFVLGKFAAKVRNPCIFIAVSSVLAVRAVWRRLQCVIVLSLVKVVPGSRSACPASPA